MPTVYNKVVAGNQTLIDLSSDTVAADKMLYGYTAHAASGAAITGSIPAKTSSDLTASNLTVTAPAGYYASDATKTLSDQNLVAGNVKKDVVIFGVTGTYEGGGGSGYKQYKTGTFTPTSDLDTTANRLIVSLADIGFTPRVFIFRVTDREDVSGIRYAVIHAICETDWTNRQTVRYSNTSNTTQLYFSNTAWTTESSGYLYNNGTNIYYRTTSQYILKANVEYTWEAYT